jgi:hypothetical protein
LKPPFWLIGPIITIALRAIFNSWQFNTFFPAMDEKRASPMIFMPMPLFPTSLFLLLSISVPTLTPTLVLPSMGYHNARSRRFFGTTTFSQHTLTFCIIDSYPMLGIH